MADQHGSFIDLSHIIEAGMLTYKGLPAPVICDYWTRADSAKNYTDGSSFSIPRIDMVANTGTYIDSPFHRYEDGKDLSQLELTQLAGLDGVVVRCDGETGGVEVDQLTGIDVRGKAVLIHTGWDRHWRTDAYFEGHPWLTVNAAAHLVREGAALIGIDSHNIDDTAVPTRPVHTALLGAEIPIVEHMTNLNALPKSGFRFYAVPPKIAKFGTFPVRAFAQIAF